MMEHINGIKAAITAALAALTALWGWFGWLVVAWVFCMAVDYITGSAAACKAGKWSSALAREGIWHKAGCIFAVAAAGILDLVIGQILANLPGVALPFPYTVFLCPLVVVWYILTELGSIVENAGAMGAPVPGWLAKAVAALKDQVNDAAGGREDTLGDKVDESAGKEE